jgi:hypothetical protein
MFDYLASIYVNQHQVRDARVAYNELSMKYNDDFQVFRTKFMHLANQAGIPRATQFYDLFDKLPTNLKDVWWKGKGIEDNKQVSIEEKRSETPKGGKGEDIKAYEVDVDGEVETPEKYGDGEADADGEAGYSLNNR